MRPWNQPTIFPLDQRLGDFVEQRIIVELAIDGAMAIERRANFA